MEPNTALSKKELEVMKVIWKSKKSLMASEIAKISNISISTVHVVVNNLLAKNMIVIDEIVYSGKVLSRCYKPVISAKNYEIRKATAMLKELITPDFSASSFVAALLGQEKDRQKILNELDELENLIKEKKKELMTEKNELKH